jgi:hypothetical protein
MPGTFLLIGKPGSGKTTLSCTLEHPTVIIDVDNKAHRMANIKHLVDVGNVIIHPVAFPLVGESLTSRLGSLDKAPQKEPRGYIETIKVLESIANGETYSECKTVVLDSLSRLDEHLNRLILYYRGKGRIGDKAGADMGWPGWGKFKQVMEELFTVLVQLDKNFICCAHEFIDKEEDVITGVSKIIGYYPNASGSIRTKLAGYFDEVYWLDSKIVKDKERGNIRKYYVITADREKPVRTSMVLNGVEEANLALLVTKQKLLKEGA